MRYTKIISILLLLLPYSIEEVIIVNAKEVESDKPSTIIKKRVLEFGQDDETVLMYELLKQQVSCISVPIKISDYQYVWNQFNIIIHKVKIDEWHEYWEFKVTRKHTISLAIIEKFNIKWEDTVAPILQLTDSEITIKEDEMFDPNQYIKQIIDYDNKTTLTIINPMISENNKWKIQDYEIIYQAKDRSNNMGEATLIVHVIEKEQPVLSLIEHNELVMMALKQLGKPYVWGAKGPNSFDCSGLILYLYNVLNYPLQWNQIQYGLGTDVPLDSSYWEMGDIISYSDANGEIVHHALYLGGGVAIHAAWEGVIILPSEETLQNQTLTRVRRYANFH